MKYIANATMPLLEVLVLISPQSSKNTLKSWIKEGRVHIDGEQAKNSSILLSKGQTVTVGHKKKVLQSGIPIIFEDDDLVIIDKPSGLLSVSTAFEKGETAHAILKKHYHPRKVFVIHRLDQDTSGVMVFALNQTTFEKLKELFATHEIERSYTAIVEGQVAKESGTWQSYLVEDKQYVVHETDDEDEGQCAISHYKTIGRSKLYSCLQVTLETGRKNQIRVHCESAGHPVVGDKKYGAHSNPIKRLALHAHLLAFKHPSTKKKLRFESEVPKDFYRLVPSANKTSY